MSIFPTTQQSKVQLSRFPDLLCKVYARLIAQARCETAVPKIVHLVMAEIIPNRTSGKMSSCMYIVIKQQLSSLNTRSLHLKTIYVLINVHARLTHSLFLLMWKNPVPSMCLFTLEQCKINKF